MKLAVFGGSFNPIHFGHLTIAETVKKKFGYDKVAILPAYISPFKAKIKNVLPEDRIQMIQLAIAGKEGLYCETYEIEKKGISYTADTIRYLYSKFGCVEKRIAFIMGSDLLKSFLFWKDSDFLLQNLDIILASRNYMQAAESDLKNIKLICEKFGSSVFEIKNKLIDISSTKIRYAVKNNESIQSFVPDSVRRYIIEKNLYAE